VDRYENRRLLMVALVAQAVLAVPLAVAGPDWAIVALFGALAAFATVVRPATSSMVPAITGQDAASRGYARIAIGTGLGFIAGPAIGGVLTGAFGTRTALVVDALTFAVLAAACSGLRTRRDPRGIAVGRRDDAPDEPGCAADPARMGGFRLIWLDPVLRLALSVAAIAVACAVVDNVAAPFRFMDQLGSSPGGYGTYAALWGMGGLVGSQLTPRLSREDASERTLALGNVLSGVGIAGIGMAPDLVMAFAAAFVGGVGNGMASVAQNTLTASRTPAGAHGRAFAAVGALIQAAVGVGTAVGAPLVSALGADGAMATAGGLCAVLATFHLGLVRLRRAAG
jgi:MFS family permease